MFNFYTDSYSLKDIIRMVDMIEKPLDVLEQTREKKILIKLKDDREVVGNLKAFDLHLNIWISDIEIDGKKVSDMLIRGYSILYISTYNP